MRALVNCCIGELERIVMRERRKPCAERLLFGWRHAVNKINRAVSIKLAKGNTKRCTILALRKRLEIVSERRGVDETESS